MSISSFFTTITPTSTPTIFSTENPNPNYTFLMDSSILDLTDFEVSDYLFSERRSEEDSTTSTTNTIIDSTNSTLVAPEDTIEDHPVTPTNVEGSTVSSTSNMKCKIGVKKNKEVGYRIAFRTKSELEIMDDGFKWRKYGKKTVKNSPNPRNYYRCSTGGCHVKKRVERDGGDSSYVITTYEGVHNHESPSVVYYNQIPLMVPPGTNTGWNLENFSHSSTYC